MLYCLLMSTLRNTALQGYFWLLLFTPQIHCTVLDGAQGDIVILELFLASWKLLATLFAGARHILRDGTVVR